MSMYFTENKNKEAREEMIVSVAFCAISCLIIYFFIFISKIIYSNENVFIIVALSAFLITGFKCTYDRVAFTNNSALLPADANLSTKLFFALEAWLVASIIISFLLICMWLASSIPQSLFGIIIYVPAILIAILIIFIIYDLYLYKIFSYISKLYQSQYENKEEQAQYKLQCDQERYKRQEEGFRKFRIAYIKALRSPVSYEIVTNYRNFDIAKDHILTSTSALSDTYTGEAKSWLFSAKREIEDLGEFGKNLSDLIEVAVSNFWDYEILSEDCSRLHRIIWLCARAITLYREKLDRMYKKRTLDKKTFKVVEHMTEGMDLTNESDSLDDMLRELRR